MPPCVQTCASPAEKSKQEGDGITKTKRSVFTSTKQAHYIQTMPHQPQSPCQAHSPQHTPLGDPRPSFMFKDYQLIQNVPETQQKKKKSRSGPRIGGGLMWRHRVFGLYLFVGFHINPLEQHTTFLGGHM